jgi:hypothetical protein
VAEAFGGGVGSVEAGSVHDGADGALAGHARLGVGGRFVQNCTLSGKPSEIGPFTNDRLWKEAPTAAKSGDLPFTTLFQNVSQRQPYFERALACSFGQIVRRPQTEELEPSSRTPCRRSKPRRTRRPGSTDGRAVLEHSARRIQYLHLGRPT